MITTFQSATVRFREFASSAEGQNRMAAFFERAWESAKYLGSFLGNLVGLFANLGRAALPAGMALVGMLDLATQRARDFASSIEGQAKIKAFFDQAVPAVAEFGRLVAEVGKAFISFASMPGNAELIKQIRTELLPAFLRLWEIMAQSGILTQAITLLTDVINVLAKFAPVGVAAVV